MTKLHEAWHDFERNLLPEQILTAEEATSRFGQNTLGQSRNIAGALYPKNSEEIYKIVQIASRYRVSLHPVSTGNNWGYGCSTPLVDDAFIVHLSRMNKISHFDEELGVITIEPGVTLGQLYEYLKDSAFLMPATGAGPKTSLVGNALERGYGVTAYSDTFGACLGLKAILPDGTSYQSPLLEVATSKLGHKWGIGPYLDGIFTQSNFGIIYEMTFALRRCPREIACVMFEIKSDHDLVNAIDSLRNLVRNLSGLIGPVKITGHHYAIAEVINSQELRKKNPWIGFIGVYVEGALRQAVLQEMREHLLAHVHDFSVMLYDRLTDQIRSADGITCERVDNDLCRILAGKPTEFAIGMTYLRSASKPRRFEDLDPQRDRCGIMWFAPLLPFLKNSARDYLSNVRFIFDKYGFLPAMTLTSLSDRCLDSAAAILFDGTNESETKNAHVCFAELKEKGQELGFVPYRLTTAAMPEQRYDTGFSHLRTSIKKAIDPLNLISPGRYE